MLTKFCAIIAAVFILLASAGATFNVQKLDVAAEKTANIGEAVDIELDVWPQSTENLVELTSSDERVLSISSDGVITAVGAGTATVTAAANGHSDSCAVTVKILTKGISAAPEMSLIIGKRVKLKVDVEPWNATDKALSYESSDPTIVKVDSNGYAEAKSKGEATIKITGADGAETKVKIKTYLAAESMSLNVMAATLTEGSEFALTVGFTPADADYATALIYESDNTTVATVDDSGTVRGVSPGTAVITVTSEDGLTAQCTVTVVAR